MSVSCSFFVGQLLQMTPFTLYAVDFTIGQVEKLKWTTVVLETVYHQKKSTVGNVTVKLQ